MAEMIRAATVASLLPIFFLYVLLDKPDYKIMNAVQFIVVPTARVIGDGLSWPLRATGRFADNFRAHTRALRENEELRVRLDAALANRAACDIAILENQRLERLLEISREGPLKTVVARVVLEHSVFRHAALTINRGTKDGIHQGQAVVSMDGNLVGIVTDVFDGMAKVRGLEDTRSNIPVRVAGTGVYGFLRGTGTSAPVFEFFSDQEFVPARGMRLVSSGVRGNLPNGIFVGIVDREGQLSARVRLGARIGEVHEVMILMFDGTDGYRN